MSEPVTEPTTLDPRGCDYAQAIVDTMREPFLVLSPDLRVLRANRSFCRTFRVEPGQVEGLLLSDVDVGQWDIPQLTAFLRAAFTDGSPSDGLELVTEPGSPGARALLLNAQQLSLDGEPRAILLMVDDVTERRQTEATLAVSEVRYRRLFETAQDGILLVHAHTGETIDANPFLEDLLGYSHEEMIGKKLWEMGPFKDVAASRLAFAELQHEKYIRYEDLPLETKAGKKINVEFVSNVYPVNGEDIIQCNIRDITDRRYAEEQLHALHLELEDRVRERTAELAQANQALEREIVERERVEAREHMILVEERTRIAREIHDTLAQGFTGIVIQLEAAEDVLDEEPEEARTHVLQARALARESLTEARRSVWALRPQALEADDLGYAFLHLANKLAQESGTQVEFTLQGIPRPMSQDTEHHLLRIGQEALTNALKHAHAAEIRVALTYHENKVELIIEDSGDGFDADSPAYQRGLGLRGMKERAADFGGQFTITSVPGNGTRVGATAPALRPEGVRGGED